MTLLGQHGQRQDYARGVHLVRLAAQTADENAPQGAYVCTYRLTAIAGTKTVY